MTPSGKRLTAQATLALGVRRNLSYVAAGDFGALLLKDSDISGSTALRAELKAATSVAASMKDYATNALAMLQTSSGPERSACDLSDISFDNEAWNLMLICIRADATKSSIWKREKLHVTEADMGLVSNSARDFPGDSRTFIRTRRCLRRPQSVEILLSRFTSVRSNQGIFFIFLSILNISKIRSGTRRIRKCLAAIGSYFARSDLQVVGGCTAEHCAGLIQKQLNSIGMPSVADLKAELDREMLGLLRNVSVKFAFVDSFPETLRRLQKCLVKSGTQASAAADQLRCTWTLQTEGQTRWPDNEGLLLAWTQTVMYIASDCYLHIFHSAARSGLQLLDDLTSHVRMFFPARNGKVRQVLWITCKSRKIWRGKHPTQ